MTRATWSCARAWSKRRTCHFATNKSTGWPPTKRKVPHRVFLKMNTGMNRLGFVPERFRAAWIRLNALPQVEEISLMQHFPDADGPKGITAQLRL